MKYVIITAENNKFLNKKFAIRKKDGLYYIAQVTDENNKNITVKYADGTEEIIPRFSSRNLGRAVGSLRKKGYDIVEVEKVLSEPRFNNKFQKLKSEFKEKNKFSKGKSREESREKSLEKKNQNTYNVFVGYWGGKGDDVGFPMPKKKWKSGSKKEFYKLFEKFISKCRPRYCHGSSICRICKEKNGSGEYKRGFSGKTQDSKKVTLIVIIPEGYMHYIKEHNINAPVLLFKSLLDKDMDTALSTLIPVDEKNRIYTAL